MLVKILHTCRSTPLKVCSVQVYIVHCALYIVFTMHSVQLLLLLVYFFLISRYYLYI